MLIIYALTYTLMPSLRSETDILVIYLFSAIILWKYKVFMRIIARKNPENIYFVLSRNNL